VAYFRPGFDFTAGTSSLTVISHRKKPLSKRGPLFAYPFPEGAPPATGPDRLIVDGPVAGDRLIVSSS